MKIQINLDVELLKDTDLLKLVTYNAKQWTERVQETSPYKEGRYKYAILYSGLSSFVMYRPNVDFLFRCNKDTLFIRIRKKKEVDV